MLIWVGKLFVLGGCAAFGIGQAVALRQRTACLERMREAVEVLERELTFSLPTVEALIFRLEQCTTGAVSAFFCACRVEFQSSGRESWSDSWKKASAQAPLPVTEEDLQLFGEIGQILGRYDGESQRIALKEIHERLQGRIAIAREREGRLCRVWVTLGCVGGLFCVILL